jgi:ferric-dicitrate binding protein FerR (iron transport regulator)
MTVTTDDDARIEREAARWVRLMRREASTSAELRREFAQWAMTSESHVRHFFSELAFDAGLRSLAPLRQGTVEAWLAGVRASGATRDEAAGSRALLPVHAGAGERDAHRVTRATTRESRYRAPRLVPLGLAAAAALILMIGALLLNTRSDPESRMYTANTARSVVLDDGSGAGMSAGSTLQTRFSPAARDARQASGQITFNVRDDAGRPFVLETPRAVVEVLGTNFTVDVKNVATEVEVFEGKVRVSDRARTTSVELAAHEKTRVSTAGGIEHPRYVFRRSTLAEVADIFNRRNGPPRFIVQGAACTRLISAALNIEDPEALIRDLRGNSALTLTELPDAVVIRERGDTSPAVAGNRSDCNRQE